MRPLFRPTRLAALLLGLGCIAQAHAEALPAVVDKVLLQQPSVRSAQALLRAADAQITQARSDFLPSVGLSYRNADSRDETQGRPLDRNIRRSDASLRWNIFNGATDTNRLRAAGFTRDAADADLDNVLEQVAYEITENYSDVVRLRLGFAGEDFGYAIALGLPPPPVVSAFGLDPRTHPEVDWLLSDVICYPARLLGLRHRSSPREHVERVRAEHAAIADAVRLTARTLAAVAPGASVEVRVPPFAAVQLALDDAGRHRRGTPPNVVECSPEVMLRLAAGSLTWLDALATHQVRASGTRSDLAGVFPLIG